jgi:hypothetical protein
MHHRRASLFVNERHLRRVLDRIRRTAALRCIRQSLRQAGPYERILDEAIAQLPAGLQDGYDGDDSSCLSRQATCGTDAALARGSPSSAGLRSAAHTTQDAPAQGVDLVAANLTLSELLESVTVDASGAGEQLTAFFPSSTRESLCLVQPKKARSSLDFEDRDVNLICAFLTISMLSEATASEADHELSAPMERGTPQTYE